MTNQQKYQARHAKAGLCRSCSRRVFGKGVFCDKCRVRRQKSYWGRRRNIRLYTCSKCGGKGHNSRVCAKKKG